MPIESFEEYHPMMNLPVYLKLIPDRHNDYSVMSKYDVRIPDAERQSERGGDGPYNYTHECLLIGKQELTWREVPDALLAMLGHTASRSEAIKTVCIGEGEYDDGRELLLLTYLRLDKAHEWIEGDGDIVEPPFTVEDYEGNLERSGLDT